MTGVVIATRIAWVQATTVLGHTVDRVLKKPTRHVGFRQRCVTSWAGFRGAVSLAAALAVPMTTNSGAPFPDRNLIIFVVSVVILVTVLVQGTSLPTVVRWARMPEDVAHANELQLARTRSAQAALDALPTVADELGVAPISSNTWKRNTKNARCSSWPMAPTPRPAIWPSATIWSGACV